MTVVTSPDNARLKLVRLLQTRKGRQRSGQFIAEGEDLVAAAIAAGWDAVDLLVADGSGLSGTEVDRDLLDSVSTLGSGTRIIGIYKQRWAQPAGPCCICPWGVRDPGNIGTIVRSAAAFGASVALGGNSANPFSPKAVRASMGAIFEIPVARVKTLDQLPGVTVALIAGEDTPLHTLKLATEVTLVIGGERSGIPAEIAAECDVKATIPIATESLNAAMAATIGLYETQIQRLAIRTSNRIN